MKKKINLIPEGLAVSSKIASITKQINKISVILGIVAILSAISLISYLVYLNLESKKLVETGEILKSEIISLEKSEQKLILAKDKLSKIESIRQIDSIDNELDLFKEFRAFTSSNGTKLQEVIMSPTKTEINIWFPDLLALGSGMLSMAKLNNFTNIVLSSLSYNIDKGYFLNLVIND
jgi:hypothetical protein